MDKEIAKLGVEKDNDASELEQFISRRRSTPSNLDKVAYQVENFEKRGLFSEADSVYLNNQFNRFLENNIEAKSEKVYITKKNDLNQLERDIQQL